MIDYGRRHIALAIALACLAGYVDATGFLATGGLFVSFMSGNSTRLGVTLSAATFATAGLILGVLCLFVLGVIAGTLASRAKRRKPAVLLLVTACLLGAAICYGLNQTHAATALMVVAMGAENTVFQRDGGVSIGLTYMTGTLVKLGQQLAGMLNGGPRNTWGPYALHWLGLVTGATLGALAHDRLLSFSLWPAVIAAAALCFASTRLPATPTVNQRA